MSHLFFNTKIQNSSIIIKCIDKNDSEELILDEQLECSPNKTGGEKYVYDINDKMYARFYKCTLSDDFIMKNRVLPIMYASISYQEKITGGVLMNLFLEFKIEDTIADEHGLINKNLNGKFYITMKPNNDIKDIDRLLELSKTPLLELEECFSKNQVIEKLINIINSEEMNNIFNILLSKIQKERIAKYGIHNSYDYEKYKMMRPKKNFQEMADEFINSQK